MRRRKTKEVSLGSDNSNAAQCKKEPNDKANCFDNNEDCCWSFGHKALVALLLIILHQLNRHVLYSMFENSKHFSHLSTMEREMAYRTEMGMYYSYFKTIAEADSALDGVLSLTRDRLTEYPFTINALQRFNLLPEILVGVQYRLYLQWCEIAGCFNRVCYRINRGPEMPPVTSCEGLGEPIYFYSHYVLELNSLLVPLTFLVCLLVTDSVGAGLVGAAAFFFNFGEATRVMWTPPLRESWAFPAIHAHLLIVTYLIRCEEGDKALERVSVSGGGDTRSSRRRRGVWRLVGVRVGLFLTTFYSLASWQFSHFNLSIFIIAMCGLHALQLISHSTFLNFLLPTTLGFASLLALMHENKMMLTSTMFTTIISAWILLMFQKQRNSPTESALYRIMAPFCVVLNSFILKSMITNLFNISDETHILNILKSKFSQFRDFHSMLYLCAKEFDFIGWDYVYATSKSTLLPIALMASFFVLLQALSLIFATGKHVEMGGLSFKASPTALLHFLLAIGYGMMAVLIMRLKLFLTPQLCILSSFLLLPHIRNFLSCRLSKLATARTVHFFVTLTLLAAMAFNGYAYVNSALRMQNEYSDYELEELLLWIKDNTNYDDSFAGSMSTMATIKLVTNRPIVNHPHYEDTEARERNKLVYSAFGRFTREQIHANMLRVHAQYLLLEVGWCWAKRAQGCSIAEAFDFEYPELSHREPTCLGMRDDPGPFKIVFSNADYLLLKV